MSETESCANQRYVASSTPSGNWVIIDTSTYDAITDDTGFVITFRMGTARAIAKRLNAS